MIRGFKESEPGADRGPQAPGFPAAQRRWRGSGQPAWGGGSDRVVAYQNSAASGKMNPP